MLKSYSNSINEVSKLFEPYSPDSLLDLCLKHCLQNRSSLCVYNKWRNAYKLRDGVTLPAEICERLMTLARREGMTIDDAFLILFSKPETTRLTRADLQHSEVTDEGISILCHHPIQALNILDCLKLTGRSLDLINRHLGPRLQELHIGTSLGMLPADSKEFLNWLNFLATGPSSKNKQHTILNTPKLMKLVINGLTIPHDLEYPKALFENLTNLKYLDLSSCIFIENMINNLRGMPNLVSLTLYNVPELKLCIDTICTITTLRYLDISQSNLQYGQYPNPNLTLQKLVDNLVNLVYLDISGTNLAGTGVQEALPATPPHTPKSGPGGDIFSAESEAEEGALTDIPGLRSRVNRPLEFLGLFNTLHEACYRHHIPAKRISGDANEDQILTAGELYLERPSLLQKALNDLFHVFRYEACRDIPRALCLVLAAMSQHLHEKHIQIAGSASLFYIVKGDEGANFNIKIRRKIITVLLNAMSLYPNDTTMLRNSCLTLIHFKIPQDVLFEYERLVDILLHMVSKEVQDDFVQRIGIYLLNSLACQVEGAQKQLVGDRGALKKMLQLIRRRLHRNFCDEVMETAWSTMWNVTDEMPINCQRFLDEGGMELFLGCLRAFENKAELLRNMMGLLGNVAEVKELRPRLMKDEYLSVFSTLLDSRSDGIEVSYNAAGILSHMMCDGEAAWQGITSVTRVEVEKRMAAAINRWDLGTQRNINYRSFEPILRLVDGENVPNVARHWAIWALANLTRVYPDKYCPLLRKEGGLSKLKPLLTSRPEYPAIPELAQEILKQCVKYESSSGVQHAELS